MSAPPPPTAPPPPRPGEAADDPSAAPGPRRLTRLRRGRLVGGVAAGLGRYLGVDRVVVRIAFVVLAFVPFPGFGVLVYVAMLLLVPEQDADGAVTPTRLTERTPGFWVGLGLVGVATFALVGVTGDGWFAGMLGIGPQRTSTALLPLLLIGLGVALWVNADRRPSDPSLAPVDRSTARPTPHAGPAPAADRPPPTTSAWQPPAATTRPVWETPPPPTRPPAPTGPTWTPPPVPRRSRSPLGRITLGLTLLAVGAAWAIDLLDVAHVPASSMLAIALLVLGLGLLVGSIYGRARWLVAVVAFVLPATLGAVAIEDLGIDLSGGFDEREVIVTEADQLDQPITIAGGSLTLDLRELPGSTDVTVDASVGGGELIVLVPEGSGLRGSARVEVGELHVLDDRSTGVSVRRTFVWDAEPGRATFDLDLRVGAGELTVRSVPVGDGEAPSPDEPLTDDTATTEVQP